MILFENTEVMGWKPAIRGMRNPMDSWDKSDSFFSQMGCDGTYNLWGKPVDEDMWAECGAVIGPNDHDLMARLSKAGPVEAKYRRMIVVYVDITAPLYWWEEFEAYNMGIVVNSCSTMQKVKEKEFTLEDFSCEHILGKGIVPDHTDENPYDILQSVVNCLNYIRSCYLQTENKLYWRQMIQLLPSSYNQKRTVMLNYEVLANIYQHWSNRNLDEWRDLHCWITNLPWFEIIII